MEYVLVHHGILGMKWGVRRYQNPDGSLTDLGRERYASAYKSYSEDIGLSSKYDSSYGKFKYAQDRVGSKNDIVETVREQARDSIEKSQDIIDTCDLRSAKLMSEYETNPEIQKEYAMYSAIAASYELGENQGRSLTLNELSDLVEAFQTTDLDQGYMNSAYAYAHLNDKMDELTKNENKKFNASRQQMAACEDAVNDILGEYGNTPISTKYYRTTVAKDMADDIVLSLTNKASGSTWSVSMIYDAYGNPELNAEANRKLDKAYNFVSKVCDNSNSGWTAFNLAVEKLGLGDVPSDELTRSQLDDINDYVRRHT